MRSKRKLRRNFGRLLLIGNGGLAKAKGVWDVQFVDLPPFDREQTAAFLSSRLEANGEVVTDEFGEPLAVIELMTIGPGVRVEAVHDGEVHRRPVRRQHRAGRRLWRA